MSSHCNTKRINFHCEHITGCYYHHINNLVVDDTAIVVNVGNVPAVIAGEPIKSIAPQQSTILQNTHILSGEHLIVVKVLQRENLGCIIFQDGWKTAYELFGERLKNVALWRSPLEEIASISLNPYHLTATPSKQNVEVAYSIKVNLWFASEHTDCAIHNQHDFIEFHTQITGLGRMQKFTESSKSSLYEDQLMAEGHTHKIFCSATDERSYHYPWHQYYADTDCVWMVIELHPKS